jgi:hypothetical protein
VFNSITEEVQGETASLWQHHFAYLQLPLGLLQLNLKFLQINTWLQQPTFRLAQN